MTQTPNWPKKAAVFFGTYVNCDRWPGYHLIRRALSQNLWDISNLSYAHIKLKSWKSYHRAKGLLRQQLVMLILGSSPIFGQTFKSISTFLNTSHHGERDCAWASDKT